MIRFQLTTGEVVEAPPLNDEILNIIPEYKQKSTLAEMLEMFKNFKSLTNLTVKGRVYNPQYIVWIELHSHELLKERFPDLEWWDD